jgi:hypothetical protein
MIFAQVSGRFFTMECDQNIKTNTACGCDKWQDKHDVFNTRGGRRYVEQKPYVKDNQTQHEHCVTSIKPF